MNNQAAQTMPDSMKIAERAQAILGETPDRERLAIRLAKLEFAALSQPAGVPMECICPSGSGCTIPCRRGWRRILSEARALPPSTRDNVLDFIEREILAATPAASGGEDIVDAVDDPNGTCPTCHQGLRTDASQQPPSGASVSERARDLLAAECGVSPGMVNEYQDRDVIVRLAIRAIERALSSPRQEGEANAWIFYFKDDDGSMFVRLCHSRYDIERAIINDWWSGDDAVADNGERMAPQIADDLIRTGVFHAEDGSCYAQKAPAPPVSTAASTQGDDNE